MRLRVAPRKTPRATTALQRFRSPGVGEAGDRSAAVGMVSSGQFARLPLPGVGTGSGSTRRSASPMIWLAGRIGSGSRKRDATPTIPLEGAHNIHSPGARLSPP